MRLTVIEHRGEAMSPPLSVLLSAPGFTIGRGADNHLILPDETRQISRLQAAIHVGASGVQLKNLSTVCPIEINDQLLPQQAIHLLAAGDHIRIGAYLLSAHAADAVALAPVATPVATPAPTPLPVQTLAVSMPESPPAAAPVPAPVSWSPTDIATPPSGGGFMDLFDGAAPAAAVATAAPAQVQMSPPPMATIAPPPPTPPKPVAADIASPPSTPPAAFWEDLVAEFSPQQAPATLVPASDLHAAPLAAPHESAAKTTQSAAEPDALTALRGVSVDPLALFDTQPAGPNALFEDGPSSLVNPQAFDPIAGLGLSPPPEHTAEPDRTSALREHFQPPRATAWQDSTIATPAFVPAVAPTVIASADPVIPTPQTPTGITPPAAEPAPQQRLPDGNAAELITAFAQGAGLGPDVALDAEQLRLAGRLTALMLGGAMALLSSRTIIKREVKADLTMILERENNPLKLLPDASTVLKQMFGPPFPGFMPPEQAVDDAFDDLHAHQIGMVAGMRAALHQLLHKVSPAVVEQQLGAASWHEKLAPRGRDGRAWAHYRALHENMIAAVEDDFHAVFGASFLAAYDAEVEHYRRQRRKSAA
ncbi:type VI secretion system-associated FHA domain protein TagH [Andreprevotia chitinilytica]|uniref:type VI secretion system-associated FHA domain protein TagH n=1 Tax=Andreprevotia chitinilytica TaxID=396808 RepID=UPI0005534B51|nr:type VI secretion system-associated FHA domain protein TagH [Andreprevotia chitinilytica]